MGGPVDAARRGARPAGVPGADRHPAGAQPAAHAGPPPRGVRRRVAARAAADQPRRGRRRRARRERLDRDAHRAGDARARPSGRCSCCARSSTSPYDEIAEAVGKSPAAVRQIAHRAREHVAARRPRMRGQPRRAAGGRRAVPGRGARAATCRGCWTSSRRTWSSSPTAAAWWPRRRDPIVGARQGGDAARRAAPGSPPTFETTPMWLNGAPGGADRPRRRARHGDEPGGRGRPDHPDLRDPQPAQAGPAGRGDGLSR